MLNKEDIKKYEEKLREEKKKVLTEIEELETPTDFGDDIDHGEEEAEEDAELENRGAMADTLKKKAENIEHALNKIAAGKDEFGVCENCGMEIEKKVLDASPESRYCEACNKKFF